MFPPIKLWSWPIRNNRCQWTTNSLYKLWIQTVSQLHLVNNNIASFCSIIYSIVLILSAGTLELQNHWDMPLPSPPKKSCILSILIASFDFLPQMPQIFCHSHNLFYVYIFVSPKLWGWLATQSTHLLIQPIFFSSLGK